MFESAPVSNGPTWTLLYSTAVPISRQSSWNMSILKTAAGYNVNVCKVVNDVRLNSVSLRKADLELVIMALESNAPARSFGDNKFRRVS